MVGSFDAVHAPTDEIHEASRAVDRGVPVANRSGIPAHMFPGTGNPRSATRQNDDTTSSGCEVRGERDA